MDGRIEVPALPQVWREKMQQYLGVAPEIDRDGVLQDVHWASGAIGYFPSYTLGNIYAAQLMRAAEDDLGDLDEAFAAGEFRVLLGWLRPHVQRVGQSLRPAALIAAATDHSPSCQPLLEHLDRTMTFLESA